MTEPRTNKIGVLHSASGTMALDETLLRDVILMETARVNAAGGLLGAALEPVVLDPGSNWMAYRGMAHAMIHQHGVAAIFGCWTSVSRKSVLPVVEEADCLLFYPVQYEGEERSRSIFYLGATPNQQAIPAVRYMMSAASGAYDRFFFIGTDYVYPRTTNRVLKSFLAANGVEAGAFPEIYVPFGHGDWAALVEELRRFRAGGRCAVISTINGHSNLSFYRALRQAGFDAADIPVMAFSVSEAALQWIDPEDISGHYACWSYFMSHPAPENAAFLKAWRAYDGGRRPVNDPMEAAVIGFRMWCHAVSETGTTASAAVRQYMYGQTVPNLSGTATVMNVNHHLEKPVFIGRATTRRQFDIVWQAPSLVAGDPFAAERLIADARAASAQRELLDALPTPLIVLDDGAVRYRSPSTDQYFGAEIAGPALAALRAAAMRGDGPAQAVRPDITLRDVAGHERHLTAVARQIVFAGRPATLLSLADVTHMHAIEERLRATNVELQAATEVAQAADRAKSEFLATMSHELRTPLNAVIGFAEIMSTQLMGPIGNPQYRDYAQDIMRSGHHLLSLINDILDFAKVDAGKLTLDEQTVDLRKIGESAIRLLCQQAASAGITMPTRIAAAPLLVRADGRRLRQICLNLIGNAIKFTPSGGRVDVTAAVVAGAVRLEVRDTGVGIRPEELPDVVKPFRQANQSLSRRHNGTGLGLSITDRLVRLHGGTLTLTSAPGKGTVATVTLPAERTLAGVAGNDAEADDWSEAETPAMARAKS